MVFSQLIIAAAAAAASPGTDFPGDPHLHPTIHFTPAVVSTKGGWHDVAGAITHNGVHHIYQGTGWNHAHSTDLVHWQTGPHGPSAIHETYAGMDSDTDPCSGYVTKDPLDANRVCAGFRQCGSNKGVDGMNNWDVPLELRCALDDDLTAWSTDPDYLFNVSFWRGVPYDPARPWQDKDGMWYQLLSLDGCNATTRALPCEAGGQLGMWRSPALRGVTAKWEQVGPVFTSNATVLGNGDRGHLTKEFVTIDFLGTMEGDPDPANGTKIFLNNVGGNGGGEGCCSGTTSYFPLSQSAPGAVFEQVAPQGMVDWGSFLIVANATGTGTDLLTGTGSRGLSMARTLGSEEADQVTKPGRRVLIGWTGPANSMALHNQGSAQSLPRELTLAKDKSLLQRFVPELQTLRKDHSHADAAGKALSGTQACEVSASFPASCGAKGSKCGVSVLGKAGRAAEIVLDVARGLVTVDATALGNPDVRAGPLPAADADGGWTVSAVADHSILEIIVNSATAFVVYAYPDDATFDEVALVGVTTGATLDIWSLMPANNM